MGYYSDVALCLTRAGVAQLATVIEARVAAPHRLCLQRHKGLDRRRTCLQGRGHRAVAFFWSCIKWYADFVGENHDDTEVNGGFWDNTLDMCLVRGIAFG